MNFVYPAFLYALSLIAIPIIIHLFNFRRYRTVYFTNVKFLKEIKEETAVQSRLKHWLVLISRILAIIFLVLAFAQPIIPLKESNADILHTIGARFDFGVGRKYSANYLYRKKVRDTLK